MGGCVGELPVLDGVAGGALGRALCLAVAGDVGVGEDPVEPGLDVGAGLILVELNIMQSILKIQIGLK